MKKKLPDIAKQLHSLLSPHGFSRKSSTWRRDNGWCIDVIEFQRSQFEPSFTINIGVLTKSVHAVAWGVESSAYPMAGVCTVDERLNALTKRGDGGWWDTDNDTWLAGVTADIQQVVLPFLERMHDRKGQREFLENRYPPKIRDPLRTIYFAILTFELGDRTKACSLLKNYKPRAGDGWAVRRAEVADRLGCSKN
jgi:hypothetical protein